MAALSDHEVPFPRATTPPQNEFLNQVNVTIPLNLLQCTDCGRICHKTVVIQCGHKYCASCLLPRFADRNTNCGNCHRIIGHKEIVYSADWDQMIEAVRLGNDMAEMEDTEPWDRREMAALKTILRRYHGYNLNMSGSVITRSLLSPLRTDTVYTVDSMETAMSPRSPPRVPVEEPIELGSSSSEESTTMGSGLMDRAVRVERGDLRGYETMSSSISSDSTMAEIESIPSDTTTAAEDSASIEVISLASSSTAQEDTATWREPTARNHEEEENTSSSVVILSDSFPSAWVISGSSPARRIQPDNYQARQLLDRYLELFNRLDESMTLATAHE